MSRATRKQNLKDLLQITPFLPKVINNRDVKWENFLANMHTREVGEPGNLFLKYI